MSDLDTPVVVFETETGRVFLLRSRNETIAFAEEFWDIPEDFLLWTVNGRPIELSRELAAGRIRTGAPDVDALRGAIERALETSSVKPEDVMPLREIRRALGVGLDDT